ncbi:hypothetical protein TWF694_001291 [Orbilia ellipsospora]|uniref:Carboxypeptidase n=1 Tax=Orbilia ellipsospora TaxID=2528407 RepID=A0AAV9XSS6_9PEZI
MKRWIAAIALCLHLTSTVATPAGPGKRPNNFFDQTQRQMVAPIPGANVGTLPVRTFDTSSLGIDPKVKQFSGYIDDKGNNKHYFYWFFESRRNPATDPVVLWLNGGPGCSGLMGVFMQGPSNIKNGKLLHNPNSLTNEANVIFLDQPVNTGFSHSPNRVQSTEQSAKDGYTFLKLWFEKFPQYADHDFHIAGESYAGQFVPAFAREIVADRQRKIKLKSILVGSGLTDAKTYYPYYYKLSCGKANAAQAFVDANTCRAMEQALPQCVKLIETCYASKSNQACNAARNFCDPKIRSPFHRSGRSMYDYRKVCGTPGAICDLNALGYASYINQPNFLKTLGVQDTGRKYDYCNDDVVGEFRAGADGFRPHHLNIAEVLKANVPVFVYGGDADFICPVSGNQDTVENLQWSGKGQYNQAKFQPYMSKKSGQKVGETKSSKGLKFTRIHDAGHEVGWYQMDTLAQMYSEWFADVKSGKA